MSFRPVVLDEFQSLLRSRQSAEAPTDDEFSALLSKSTFPGGAAGETAGEATGASAPPPRPQMSTVQNLAAGTADAVDLIWGGLFAPIIGATGEVVTRAASSIGSAAGITRPKTRKEVSAEAETVRNDLNRKYGQPARDVLTALGVIPEGESYIGEKVIGPAMKKIDEWGGELEASSGGLVLKEDVNAFVNMLFGALGAKGAQVGAKTYVDRQKARYIATELERRKALEDAKALETETRPGLQPQPGKAPVPPEVQAHVDEYNRRLARSLADEAEPADMADWRISRPQSPEMEAFLRDYSGPPTPEFRPSGRTGSGGPSSPWPLEVPDYVREQAEARARAQGAVTTPEPSITGPASDATTMMESRRRPDLAYSAAAGIAAGAALYALAPDREEAALLAATGAGLAVGRGRGLTLAALQTMPDATPLRAILDQSGYTFSTLEKLPSNRFEFSRQQITDLLKRQEVTKMERDIMEQALRAIPGDGPVTAKQLMTAVKQATGDFELGARKTNKSLGAAGLHGLPGRSRLQMGAAAPSVMQAITFFGGGAALGAILSDSGEKGKGALKGLAAGGAALVGLSLLSRSGAQAVASVAREAGEKAAYTAGVISRDIKAMSEPLLRRMTKNVKDELVGQHDRLLAITPFVEGFKSLPKAVRDKVDAAWLAGDRAAVIQAIGAAGKPGVVADLRKAIQVRRGLERDLRAVGRLTVPLEEFPRVVADMKGLLEQLDADAGSTLARVIRDMNTEAIKLTGEPLSPFDITNLIGQTPGAVNKYSRFFASASESFPLWVRAATRELERIRFLDQDAVLVKKNGRLNLSASIQNVVNRELAAGRITATQGDKLRGILMDRFGPGERPTPGYAQTYKNVVYTALLSNPVATATQLVDVGVATAIHGMMPTLKALQAITTKSPSRWTLADVGLVNHLTEEMLGSGRKPLRIGGIELSTARILEQSLRMGGLPVLKHLSFSAVDELGKLTHLNAANAKFQRLARSAKGQAEIQRRYGNYFGSDLGQLMTDLRTGAKTPLVGELLFRELSDVQPISKLEVPQAYLANPSARFAYTLKSFLIRQINLMIDRGVAEIAKGDARSVARGTSFLAKYMLVLGAAGASVDFIKDLLMGRRAKLEWGDVAENMLKGWGWSSYTLDALKNKGPASAAGQLVVPPWKLFDEIARGDPKAMQYLPWVGKLYYNWFMGGNEKADISKAKKDAKREKEAAMTDEDRREREELLRLRREQRRQRDLERLQ